MRSTLQSSLIVAGVTLALLCGLELAVRAGGWARQPAVEFYIADWEAQWHGDFYVLEPKAEVNRDGLRDREHDVENSGDLRRVVFLGDSVAFGYGLPARQSLPAALERVLRARGEPVEVFTVALPGWSTRQQRIAYRTIARKYRPRQVILGVCLNDVAEMQNNLGRPPAWIAVLYRRSHLVRLLLRARQWEIARVEELFSHPDSPKVREGWRRTLDEIRELAREVRSDGADFGIVTFPFRFQVEPGAPEPAPQAVLEQFARREGLPHLDALPILKPLGAEAFLDYDHLSAAGTEWLALAMAQSELFP